MILIIAEKPSLGRNIAAALGAGRKEEGCLVGEQYIVTWAFGHLFSLCDIEDYEDVPRRKRTGRLTIFRVFLRISNSVCAERIKRKGRKNRPNPAAKARGEMTGFRSSLR